MSNDRQISRRGLSAATIAAFLILGVGVGSLGPALPALARRWGAPLDQAGTLFVMVFLSASITITSSSFLLDRVGRKPLLIAGFGLMALGMTGIATAPGLGVALAAGGLLGLGLGWLNVTLNVFVAEFYPRNRGQALNLMNTAFGVGALIAPLAVGFVISGLGGPPPVLIGIAGAAVVIAGAYLALRFPPQRLNVAAEAARTRRSVPAALREPYVLLLALMFFLYAGAEVSFSGWVYSFARQGPGLEETSAALVTTIFWSAFTLGRLSAGLLARRIAGARLVVGGALLGVVGVGLIALAGGSAVALFAGAILVGGGFGPIFPPRSA